MKDIGNTIFVSFGILVASFFSYLLQFYLGRTLSVNDFGMFNALLSVAAIVGVPASVFGIALIKEVSALSAKKEDAKVAAIFWQSTIWSIAIGFVVFGFFYIFRENLLTWFKITNFDVVTAFAFYLSLTFLWSVPYAYFQGLLRYRMFSFFIAISSFLRFLLPVLFLLKFNRVFNAYLAMAIATVLVTVTALLLLSKLVGKTSDLTAWKELRYILRFSWPVMATNLCLMAFNNNDLILVRSNFTPSESGYYAGVVTLGKILLFGSTSVATVMFPKIARLKSGEENTKKHFNDFLKLQVLILFAGSLLFVLFPRLIALAFFGTKFLDSVKYLPLYSVFVGLYVILNFLILFLFAVDITDLYNFLVILVMVQVLLINNFHNSLYQVIYINISVLFVAVSIAMLKSLRFLKKS